MCVCGGKDRTQVEWGDSVAMGQVCSESNEEERGRRGKGGGWCGEQDGWSTVLFLGALLVSGTSIGSRCTIVTTPRSPVPF